jgi:diguanylate cyclase (GGDEF)-like protein
MRVMLLGNDPQLRKVVSRSLNNEDYEIVDYEDNQIALESMLKTPIEILISEYDSGRTKGTELINSILASDLEDFPFVLFITTAQNQQEAVDSLGPIPGDYIVKPVEAETLKARIALAERLIMMQERLTQTREESDSLELYDQLTGVLNRQAVYERSLAEVSRAQREESPLSLAMVEVLNLSEIRDKHGPEVRDQAIRYVARATRANVRIYDLVGRWIGAKFLLLLPGASIENATRIAERIRNSISTIGIRLPDRVRLQIDIAIGLTRMQATEKTPLYVLVEEANEALTAASGEKEMPIKVFEKTA